MSNTIVEDDAEQDEGYDSSESLNPIIDVDKAELGRVADEIVQILNAAGLPLFTYNRMPVELGVQSHRVDHDDVIPPWTEYVEWVELTPLTFEKLHSYCEEHITFIQYDGRTKTKRKRVGPPPQSVMKIIRRATTERFRKINGFFNGPMMGLNGKVIHEPGFDPETGLYNMAREPLPAKFVEQLEHVSQKDAVFALKMLFGLVEEHPFVTEAGRSAAVATMLTLQHRPLFKLVPGHWADAFLAGTGKTYLQKTISLYGTGYRPASISADENREGNFDKSLETMIITGSTAIMVDNVKRPPKSSNLEKLVTDEIVDIRIYGKNNEKFNAENTFLLMVNGNKVSPTLDQRRRFLYSQLDLKEAYPEDHQYENDPHLRLETDRQKYLKAGIVILKAFHNNGCQPQMPEFASFGRWSNIIRSAMVYAGATDPVDSTKESRENDENATRYARLVHALAALIGLNKPFKSGELLRQLKDYYRGSDEQNEVIDALGEMGVSIHVPVAAEKLGYALRSASAHVVDGFRLEGKKVNNSNSYTIGYVEMGG